MRLLYFAWLRTRIGRAEETIELPEFVKTTGDLINWLRTRGDNYRLALADPAAVKIAVNRAYSGLDRRLVSGDEVALFPPVTGG
jgi:molybdopterin synthase sulfur carrier subunit